MKLADASIPVAVVGCLMGVSTAHDLFSQASTTPAAPSITTPAVQVQCGITFDSEIVQIDRDTTCQTMTLLPYFLQGYAKQVLKEPHDRRLPSGGIAQASIASDTATMYLYPSTDGTLSRQDVVHEYCHPIAYHYFGSASPPADSAFARAYRAEGAVSGYGQTNIAEGWADACAYTMTNNALMYSYPGQRQAILNVLAELHTRAGGRAPRLTIAP